MKIVPHNDFSLKTSNGRKKKKKRNKAITLWSMGKGMEINYFKPPKRPNKYRPENKMTLHVCGKSTLC